MLTDKVYTLEDLQNWNFDGISLAVVGHPIAHSLSPDMHNNALKKMAESDDTFKNWKYFKFDISPEDLPLALKKFHEKGFYGLNLTVPHKVIALTCDIVKTTDLTVIKIGAVNTLLRKEDSYEGFNTDGFGMLNAIEEHFGERVLQERDFIILGAGGAGRAAVVTCLDVVKKSGRKIWIGNRSKERLNALIDECLKDDVEYIKVFDINNPPEDFPKAGILINATSLGLKKEDISPMSLMYFGKRLRVFDMIYNPPMTDLLKEAKARKMKYANGLLMLVGQGAKALQIWTTSFTKHDIYIPIEVMLSSAESRLSKKT